MTKNFRFILAGTLGLGLVGSVVSYTASFGPAPADPTPTPAVAAKIWPTPTPFAPPKERTTEIVDLQNIAPNEEVAIFWSSLGCFHSTYLDIRVSGSDPNVAVVSELNHPRATAVRRVEATLDPKTVVRRVEVPFDAKARYGFAAYLDQLRDEPVGGCTTTIRIYLLRTRIVGEDVTEFREELEDDTCELSCDWLGDMYRAIDAARTAANAAPQAGS